MARRHGNYPRDIVPPRSTYHDSARFGRMFGDLPPFAPDTPAVRDALLDVGRAGAIMAAGDELSVGPVRLITGRERSERNPDDLRMTAGTTFLGRFIDHDVTFDPTSALERQADPEQVANFRTPTLALDGAYGSGPLAMPHLFDRAGGPGIRFPTEEWGTPRRHDVPRNAQRTALVGEPRNDENLVVSQLHPAVLRLHDAVCQWVADESDLTDGMAIFTEAQRIVRWHYRWIVPHEFLAATRGERVVADVLEEGQRFYGWRHEPFIRVEFSVAAYRFGHSQVRPSYRASFGAGGGDPFFALIFDASLDRASDGRADLRGSCRAARRFVDRQTFLDFGDATARPNRRIDTRLSSVPFALPDSVVALPDRGPTRHRPRSGTCSAARRSRCGRASASRAR